MDTGCPTLTSKNESWVSSLCQPKDRDNSRHPIQQVQYSIVPRKKNTEFATQTHTIMLSIKNDGTYTTHGKTHTIARYAMFCHLERLQSRSNLVEGPPSFRDIPARLNETQRLAWNNKDSSRPLDNQQEQLVKEFKFICAPMICETLLLNGRYKNLQTAILDYTMDEWLDAIYQTLSRVIPWWFYYKHNIFEISPGAKINHVRLIWLYTCIGPRNGIQEENHLDSIAKCDLVELASEIDSSPPITPTDRSTEKFVNSLLQVLEKKVPNGYLHTLFQPNLVRVILEYFGFTSCLDLRWFFEVFRDRESELTKWINMEQGVLCPRGRARSIPKNMLPHDIATTFNGLTAAFMGQKAYVHDRDLSLPQCLEKYGVLNDYYTAEQLEALHEYVRATSNYVLHHLREDQVEEAVEMMLQDLECHPHLTFSLKLMKSARVFSLSHLTRVVMGHLRYVEVRLEFWQSRTTDGEVVTKPDLSCVFIVPNTGDPIEIDSENEQDLAPPPLPPALIQYEDNSSKSHEIAKRNAQKWIVASTNAVTDYLKTFEMLRDTKLCRNCLFSRRFHFNVGRIAHDTAKCSFPNLWFAMRDSGLDSSLNKKSLYQMDKIRQDWLRASEKERQMGTQMPTDSCNNYAGGGYPNLYQRLFDKEAYPWDPISR
ncbi:hypothetical protein B0I75DRAFT_146854 [Yarrowia lipolytica]|nr:hypothetical protein B0I74DRAFT_159234 [Yarrowia lipolytica]RDW51799.1 hypothetical protein B0I75DRAFT_146854 [Yarrowia lipolytica]